MKIAFDPSGADNGSNSSLNKETVVIVNDSIYSVVMTGWTLRDRDAHVFRFPAFKLVEDQIAVATLDLTIL